MTVRFTGRCLSPLMSASVNSLSREKGALVPTGEGGICDTDEHGRLRDTRVRRRHTHTCLSSSHYEPCTTALCAVPVALGSLCLVIGIRML